jgi:hypothetical protein
MRRLTGVISGEAPEQLVAARRHLTPAAYGLLRAQWAQHENYEVVRTHDSVIHVSLRGPKLAAAKLAAKGRRIGETYFRTREVTTQPTSSGRACLSCSCGYYQRVLLPCRHIFAVKRGAFEVHQDIHPQYLQIYGTDYGTELPSVVQSAGTSTGPGLAGYDPSNVALVSVEDVPPTVTVTGLQEVPDEEDETPLSEADAAALSRRMHKQSRHAEATQIWNAVGKHIIGVSLTRLTFCPVAPLKPCIHAYTNACA